VVVGVTNEPKSLVEEAIKKKRMKFPVAMVETPEEDAFGIKGFPTSFLLDVDGTILWTGHPGAFDDQFGRKALEEALGRANVPPVVPEEHERTLGKLVAKGDYGKAWSAASKTLAKAESEPLKAFVAALESMVSQRLGAARAAESAGEYGRAAALYEEVTEQFGGLPGSAEAETALATLAKNEAAKDELAAAQKWKDAMKAWREGEFEKALKSVGSIAKGYPDTPTGARAVAMLERHEGE